MHYWDTHHETMSREKLNELKLKRLQRTVSLVYERVPYYRQKMQEKHLLPGDIQKLTDISLLPFTSKDDLRETYPFGLFAAPQSEIVRIHASSGTTGKPSVAGYTSRDIDMWSEMMARAFACAGGSSEDIIQVAYGYGLFTGGLGAHYGAERIGASVIPISGGNTRRQIMTMADFGSTMLACTPSYALLLGEGMRESGIPRSQFKLRVGVFGAEPWSEGMRQQIQTSLGIEAYDVYGLSEIMGPGVAIECSEKNGLHVWEDHFIPEIVDPDTGAPLPIGKSGELVFTTITKEGMPLIRYNTHDITSLTDAPCSCGRTHLRMNKVTGRTDDMLIIRGVNVFPSQVETVLMEVPEASAHYMLVVDRVNNLDTLEVLVEISEENFSDEVRKMEELNARISAKIQSMLGISVSVKLVEPKSIERSEGKAKRIIDKRKK